jgi:cell division transport system permease protein
MAWEIRVMSRLFFFIGSALRHIGRSPVSTVVTVGTVSIVFLLLGVFGSLGHNLDRLGERLQAGLHLTVYLSDDASPDQVGSIRKVLEEAPQVDGVQHLDHKQALLRFRQRLGPRATLLDGLGKKTLPASLEASFSVRGRSTKAVAELAQQVIGLQGVEQVQYGQAWLERFFGFMGVARWAGLLIGSLIVFATLLIVSNTIRLSVLARRDEIHILKLVGATDRFVKAPFYVEGILLGSLGAALGMIGTWLLFLLAEPIVRVPLGPSSGELTLAFLPGPAIWVVVAGGALLGFLGTLTSLWRHLRI